MRPLETQSEAYVWDVLRPDGTLALYFAVENPSGVSGKALAASLDQGLSRLAASEIGRATLHLEGSGVIRGAAGDEIAGRMALWTGATPA